MPHVQLRSRPCPGGRFFFIVMLADRFSYLLTDRIADLRRTYRATHSSYADPLRCNGCAA